MTAPVDPRSIADHALPPDLLDPFRSAGVSETRVAAGQTIFQEGSLGDEAYLVLSGQVNIVRTGTVGRGRVLAVIEAGSIFGEMALLDEPKRSAGAEAATDVTLFVIPKARMTEIIAAAPQVGLWLLQIFSRRLRITNQKVSQLERAAELSTRVLASQDAERRRLARELTDGPRRQIDEAKRAVAAAKGLLDTQVEQVPQRLASVGERLENVLAELDAFNSVLAPDDLESQGLAALLQRRLTRVQLDLGVRVRLKCPPMEETTLDSGLAKTLFGLADTGVSVAVTLAKAKTIAVLVILEAELIRLVVRHDGADHNPQSLARPENRDAREAYEAIRDRVLLAGGKLMLRHTEKGNEIVASLPLATTAHA